MFLQGAGGGVRVGGRGWANIQFCQNFQKKPARNRETLLEIIAKYGILFRKGLSLLVMSLVRKWRRAINLVVVFMIENRILIGHHCKFTELYDLLKIVQIFTKVPWNLFGGRRLWLSAIPLYVAPHPFRKK